MDFSLQKKWLGLTPYQEGLKQQERALEYVKSDHEGVVLGLEHPNVITLGVRGREDLDLIQTPENFEIVKIRRGGQATIHNPGQLVIYPVLPLREWGLGARDYVCLLTKATKTFLKGLGVESFEKGEPGLYTDSGKIVAFGVQISRGVSLHGLAINVYNELSPFKNIQVCGAQGQAMDSLRNHSCQAPLHELFDEWFSILNYSLLQTTSRSAQCTDDVASEHFLRT
ncbi:MAG: lipoyl(octanoyl) transferase LipB [Bdellovibrionales bacterium]|nr:lipoyl(octanoyl) transferase LipB [Bdellovibrionales bacterium]